MVQAVTKNAINKKLKLISPSVEIERGEGYIYFIFDNTELYETYSIMVPYLNVYTVEEWTNMGRNFVEAILNGKWDSYNGQIKD